MLKRTLIAGALLCACSPAMAGGFYDDLFAHHASVHPAPHHASHWPARRHHGPVSRAGDPVTDARQSSDLLVIAQRYLGAGKVTRDPGPWCRDFVNLVAREAGLHLANVSRRAIDALGLGRHVAEPRPGDLIVMRHHVTIFAGRQGGKLLGLGGNQRWGRVGLSSYPRARVLAFVRL